MNVSLDKGQGCIIGEGKCPTAFWLYVIPIYIFLLTQCRLMEVVDLYIVLFYATLTSASDHGLNGARMEDIATLKGARQSQRHSLWVLAKAATESQ